MKLFSSLRVKSRLVLVALLFVVSISILGLFLHREQSKSQKTALLQIAGIHYFHLLIPLIEDVRLYRFGENSPAVQELNSRIQHSIDEHFDILIEYTKKMQNPLKLSPQVLEMEGYSSLQIQNLKKRWDEISKAGSKEDLDNFQNKLRALSDYIIDSSHLTLVGNLELSLLMDSALYELFEVDDRLDNCLFLLEKKLPVDAMAGIFDAHSQTVANSFRKIFQQDNKIVRRELEASFHSYWGRVEQLSGLIRKGDLKGLKEQYTMSVDEMTNFHLQVFDVLKILFEKEKRALQSQHNITLAVSLLIPLVAIFLMINFTRMITKPLSHLEKAADRLGKGLLDTRVAVINNDEIGIVSQAFNTMAGRLQALIEQQRSTSLALKGTSDVISDIAEKEQDALLEQESVSTNISKAALEILNSTKMFIDKLSSFTKWVQVTQKEAQDGQNALSQLRESLKLLLDGTRTVSLQLSTLSEKASSLKNITKNLDKVSQETNLLSINATIEAEKVGSSKSILNFSTALKKLSEQTGAAREEIIQLINQVNEASSKTEKEMGELATKIKSHVDELEKASTLLSKILSTIDESKILIPELEVSIKNQFSQNETIEKNLKVFSATLIETNLLIKQFTKTLTTLNEIEKEIT
jgi:methyl-accepting chemotaxis protein